MLKTRNKTPFEYGGSLLSNGAGTLLGLVNQLLFARLMGVETYGLMTLTLTVVLLPLSLADLGVGTAMPRFLAVHAGEKDHGKIRQLLKDSATFTALAAALLTAVLLALAAPLSRWMDAPDMHEPLLCFSFFIPALYLNRWSLGALNGLGENGKSVVFDPLVLQTFILLFSIGLWKETHDLTLVMAGTGISYLATGILGLAFILRKMKDIPPCSPEQNGKTPFREVVLHGLPVNITAIGQRLFRRGDILVVGAMLGPAAVGLYQSAYTLASGIKRLITPVNSLALYYMGRAAGQKREDKVVKQYEAAVQIGLCISLPAYLIMIVMAEDILSLLFGGRYTEAAPVLQILSAGFAAFTSVGPMGSLFNVLGKNWLRMWIMLGLGTANILLNILLIQLLGLAGAAVSTAASFFILNVIFHLFAKKWVSTHKISIRTMAVWSVAISATTALSLIHFDSLWTKVASSAAGALLVFACGVAVAYASLRKRSVLHTQGVP